MPVGVFIALFGYLLGSIPVGLILTKRFGSMDPRQAGSQNIGATNIYRTAGKKLGILTLIGDIAKGAIPVWVAIQMGVHHRWVALAGLTPVLGHVFPIFLGFKGGKGVATALGSYLIISPVAVLIEGGQHGSSDAAPVARDVVQFCVDAGYVGKPSDVTIPTRAASR